MTISFNGAAQISIMGHVAQGQLRNPNRIQSLVGFKPAIFHSEPEEKGVGIEPVGGGDGCSGMRMIGGRVGPETAPLTASVSAMVNSRIVCFIEFNIVRFSY
jgi:hypothetical protein